MNDEIKEILECLKEEDNYWSKQEHNYAFPDYYSLNREDLHLLLDYITNLQQENEHKDKLIDIANAGIEYLQQENERLKETNVYCNRTDCVGRIKDSRKYDSVYQEKEDYKSRCEKGIELIKNKLSFETYQHLKKLYDDIDSIEEIWEDYEFEDLLNILQGENNG